MLSLIKYEETLLKDVHCGNSLSTAGRGRGVLWLLLVKMKSQNGTESFLNVFPREVHVFVGNKTTCDMIILGKILEVC